jgi:hypothetical protein
MGRDIRKEIRTTGLRRSGGKITLVSANPEKIYGEKYMVPHASIP